MKIVMLGKPGSGKGTQAENLSKKLRIPIISVGNLLRNLEKKNTPLAKRLRSIMDRGKLIPDRIVNHLVIDAIEGKSSFIFDGFPRTLNEAREMERFAKPDLVFFIKASDESIYRRLSKRYECICGEIYNLATRPPKKGLLCDRCGKKLSRRPDDTKESLRMRFRVFKKKTLPVIDFYRKKGRKVVEIDGNKSIAQIQA